MQNRSSVSYWFFRRGEYHLIFLLKLDERNPSMQPFGSVSDFTNLTFIFWIRWTRCAWNVTHPSYRSSLFLTSQREFVHVPVQYSIHLADKKQTGRQTHGRIHFINGNCCELLHIIFHIWHRSFRRSGRAGQEKTKAAAICVLSQKITELVSFPFRNVKIIISIFHFIARLAY